jgi:hypothetical protein
LFVCGDALQTTHESMFHVFGLFVFVVISIWIPRYRGERIHIKVVAYQYYSLSPIYLPPTSIYTPPLYHLLLPT